MPSIRWRQAHLTGCREAFARPDFLQHRSAATPPSAGAHTSLCHRQLPMLPGNLAGRTHQLKKLVFSRRSCGSASSNWSAPNADTLGLMPPVPRATMYSEA